jgi:hypothetical protein
MSDYDKHASDRFYGNNDNDISCVEVVATVVVWFSIIVTLAALIVRLANSVAP